MPDTVPPPPTRSAPLSLLNAALTPDATTGDASRWAAEGAYDGPGVQFQPEACGDAWVEDPCDISARSIDARPAIVSTKPMLVVAGDRCSSLGFMAEDYEGRARRLLERCASKQIARELWNGEQAALSGWPNQYLTDPGSDTVTEGPTAAIAALACLEQGLAETGCGTRGMIHATPQLVTHWAALGQSILRREGGMLLTIHDTIVVSDGGYTGDGPNGVPAGASQWAYATGLVNVLLGPVDIAPGSFQEALDRSVNTVEFYASRPALVAWDGCTHIAAEVDLPLCLLNGAS